MNTTTTTTLITNHITNLATTTPDATRLRPTLISGAVVGAVTALAANAVVYAIGSIGDPIRVVIGTDPTPTALTLFEVAATTLIAIVAGTAALWVTRRRRLGDRTWAIGAAVVAVASAIPLWRIEVDTTSQLLLTAMHLFTGVCCIAAHTRRS